MLQERVKELTALHKTARILQEPTSSPSRALERVVALLPSAWQYPEVTAARIRFGSIEAASPGFRTTAWRQAAAFAVRNGQVGEIEVYYLDERPPADEGPFLKEERDLIDSLAEMLRSFFQHLLADEALRKAHTDLEDLVAARTSELQKANAYLEEQIAEHTRAQQRIDAYEQQLRKLASELSLAGAKERRAIAGDLHDHIGQALAFIRMSIAQLRGNAIFCGFEDSLDGIITLLDEAIRYTRNLTCEISSPALYELGLEAAIEGLAERFHKKHGLPVDADTSCAADRLGEEVIVLIYESVRELLTNVAKHARAGRAAVRISGAGHFVRVEVNDDGQGFDATTLDTGAASDRFGLLSIRERIKYLDGAMEIRSAPGEGTSVVLLIPSCE